MKEKDMMNPLNWGKEEFKEATACAVLALGGFVAVYILMWLAY